MTNSTDRTKALKIKTVIAIASLAFVCLPAEAYVGPGAGITMLGALWAVIAAVLFALGGLMIWPIRVLRRRFRPKKNGRTRSIANQTQEP